MKSKAFIKQKKTSVTVIIPVEPGGDCESCIHSLQKTSFVGKMEILVCEGKNPSAQRNLAASKAKGEFLLFLDSDVVVESELLDYMLSGLTDPQVAAVGGPNLAPQFETRIQGAFSKVLASWFGSAGSRARYDSVGLDRDSNEKELILCNLMIRKHVFLLNDGFRQDLYPNEENEFLNRLADQGWRVRYLPLARVRRPRRENIRQFIWQAFRYGRGRMKQLRFNPHGGDFIQLCPLVYALAWVGLFVTAHLHDGAKLLALAYFLPLVFFSILILIRSSAYAACLSLFLFPLRHGAYGLGLLAGLVWSGSPPVVGPLHLKIIKKIRGN